MNPIADAVRLLWLRDRLRGRDRWTREQLDRHQAAALRQLRLYARARSPYYRRVHAGLDGAPLGDLPILTKADLVTHFDELVTDTRLRADTLESWRATRPGRSLLGRYWLVATSGSSGQPVTIPFDEAEWAYVLASFERGTDWGGLRSGLRRRVRIATVGTTQPWHMSGRAALTLPRPWCDTLRLDVAAPLEQTITQLGAWQPDLLVAYPSIAGVLADEQLAGRLRIAPQVVMCGAEVLTDDVRRRAEAAWGPRVFDHYAASETAGIASECAAHRGLHLFEDLLIVEVVGADGGPVPPGAFGDRLLVTVLFGRTLPLIRYEITDSVRLTPDRCPCGRPFRLIDGIAGRTEDTLSLPGTAGRRVAVHPVVIHGIMDGLRIPGWQVVATPRGIDVRLTGTPDPAVDRRVAADLRAALARVGVAEPVVTIERVAALDRGSTGKAPLIALASAAPTARPLTGIDDLHPR